MTSKKTRTTGPHTTFCSHLHTALTTARGPTYLPKRGLPIWQFNQPIIDELIDTGRTARLGHVCERGTQWRVHARRVVLQYVCVHVVHSTASQVPARAKDAYKHKKFRNVPTKCVRSMCRTYTFDFPFFIFPSMCSRQYAKYSCISG